MSYNILLGTHGTGKSTLLKELAKRVSGIYTTDGFSRPVKNIKNILKLSNDQEQIIINELTKWAFLNYIEQPFVISARSLIDVIIYSNYYAPNVNTDELLQIFRANKDKIKNIFYIPIEFDLEDDGVRYLNKQDQHAIDQKMLDFIKEENLNIIEIRGSVEERVQKILTYL
jgi:predicted ATPase